MKIQEGKKTIRKKRGKTAERIGTTVRKKRVRHSRNFYRLRNFANGNTEGRVTLLLMSTATYCVAIDSTNSVTLTSV